MDVYPKNFEGCRLKQYLMALSAGLLHGARDGNTVLNLSLHVHRLPEYGLQPCTEKLS